MYLLITALIYSLRSTGSCWHTFKRAMVKPSEKNEDVQFEI